MRCCHWFGFFHKLQSLVDSCKICWNFPTTFYLRFSAIIAYNPKWLQFFGRFLGELNWQKKDRIQFSDPSLDNFRYNFYLNFARFSSAVHSRGHIDAISPNVVERFTRANHTSHHFAMRNTYIVPPEEWIIIYFRRKLGRTQNLPILNWPSFWKFSLLNVSKLRISSMANSLST